ncbi:hypothetical protein Ancab_029624 [Ancistrocladus abbreviatus]
MFPSFWLFWNFFSNFSSSRGTSKESCLGLCWFSPKFSLSISFFCRLLIYSVTINHVTSQLWLFRSQTPEEREREGEKTHLESAVEKEGKIRRKAKINHCNIKL